MSPLHVIAAKRLYVALFHRVYTVASCRSIIPTGYSAEATHGSFRPSLQSATPDPALIEGLRAAAKSLDHKRLTNGMMRAPSFSLVIFAGDVGAEVPSLFEAQSYATVAQETKRGSLSMLYSQLDDRLKSDPDIVRKGIVVAPGFTVLADPEMVVGSDEKSMIEFCRIHQTMAIVLIWERMSETVLAMEYDASGRTRRTNFCQGRPENLVNPHPQVTPQSDYKALLQISQEFGLNLGSLQEVVMTCYTLQG